MHTGVKQGKLYRLPEGDSMTDDWNDEIGELMQSAIAKHEIAVDAKNTYDAFRDVGFSKKQAMSLTLVIVEGLINCV